MRAETAELPLAAAPVTADQDRVGVNGAIAAALTRGVGSMPALYVVLVVVGGWMAVATWGPLRRLDPYPFPFLLFLDNVVQLVLCLVILVGQRVLGAAADRRSVQTYRNTEAIFSQIADLQAHLDRHDRALSRGVSMVEGGAHPWIERHRVQAPPQALDQMVSVNGRIAAWLTRRLGSVWAFYAAATTQLVWIGLAAAGVQRFDPYPFAFMSFLSTLAQLVFMIVIMVGQDVLGRAGDRRSEQTYLDAEAILHECRRMKARLTAQDRVIDSLAGYSTGQLTERLAQALHDAENGAQGREQGREQARAQARRLGESLAAVGCVMVPAFDATLEFTFGDDEVQVLARLEHQRRRAEQPAPGVTPGVTPGADWDRLPEHERRTRLAAVRRLPALLAGIGFQIVRDGTGTEQEGHEADFTTVEWDTLQRALMAAGVLVALSEGVADAEEMFALVKVLRETSVSHPRRFIRDLTAASTFNTGLHADTTYQGYRRPALDAVRSAVALVADKAPAELGAFRALLAEIAAVVADANEEGGFFGLGARRRTDNEAAALAAVRVAAGLDDAPPH